MHDKVLLATNKDIAVKPHLHGEDYYIYTLLARLKKNGISVHTAVFSKNTVKFYEQNKIENIQNMGTIMENYRRVLLFNVSPFKLLKLKFKYKLKLVMVVIFLWNKASSAISNVRSFVGDTLWQLIVDEYIATSPAVARGLKRRGIFRKIYLIPPVYTCKYCDWMENAKKLKRLEKRLPRRVRALYIGSLNPKRFSLVNVINRLRNDEERTYELNIYTSTPTRERAYKIGNVEVNVLMKILSDEEKCRVLRESYLFIAPNSGTTMDPSLSVIEAKYHGNIIARF